MIDKMICFAALLLLIKGCQTTRSTKGQEDEAPPLGGQPFASAVLEPRSGTNAQGKAWFLESENGISVVISIRNASPGLHGIHIHEKGDCSAADASSAGAHFNPVDLPHGPPDPSHFHIGDLGNIKIEDNGIGVLNLTIPISRFHHIFHDWSQIVGKSVILHARADDLVSQPAGNSGDRIACGIILGPS